MKTFDLSNRSYRRLLTESFKKIAILFAFLFFPVLSLPAYSANSYVNGAALYSQNCAYCHGNYPGNRPNASAYKLANAINRNKGGMGYLKPLTEDQIQAIANYTYTLTMSVPSTPEQYSFSLVATPVRNNSAYLHRPLGVGDIYGGSFNWQVDLPAMQGEVDILVGVSVDFLPGKIFLINADGALVDVSLSGLVFWKQATSGNINESIYPAIQTSTLVQGIYTLYLVITPAGNPAAYTLWSTQFAL